MVSGFTQHIVSADVHDVPRSVSSAFDPSSLLFPFLDSGFSSLSSHPPLSLPSSSATASLPSFSAPASTLPLLLLPSVVPSVLSIPSAISVPSSFAPFPSPLPSGSFSSAPPLRPSAPPLVSLSAPSSFPPVSAPAPPAPGSSWLSSLLPPSSPDPSSGVSSFSSASPSDDFAAVQARVLGLSAEYQAVARWFFALGGVNFPVYSTSLLISLTYTLTFGVISLRALPVFWLRCLPLLLLRLRSLLLFCFRLFVLRLLDLRLLLPF